MFKVEEPSPLKIEEQPERESQTFTSSKKSSEYQSSDTQTKKNQVQLDGNMMMDEVMREIARNVESSASRKGE
jgi:hypothetical protein